MKVCSKCKKEGEFHKDLSKKDGLHTICKVCFSTQRKLKRLTDNVFHEQEKQRSRNYRLNSPLEFKTGVRNSTLKKKYGISIADFNSIRDRQDGGCAICGRKESGVGHDNLHVDHDHKTGRVRGLLCQPCNVTLGKMNEDPNLLRKAAKYLEES